MVLSKAVTLPQLPTGTPGIPGTWRQPVSPQPACRTPGSNFLCAPLHPLLASLSLSTCSAQVHHCSLYICAKKLTKWCIMKLDRDLWQPSKNCHADNGKKKRGRSSGLCHAWTLNTDFLFFFSWIQTRGNLWERGTQQSKQKIGKQKARSKCKGNRSKLTIWAEVIYQNDLLDETGRGAVQNTAGTQERKSHFVSCHNNDNVRTDRNLLCYTAGIPNSSKVEAATLPLQQVSIGRTKLQVRTSERAMASQPDLTRTHNQELTVGLAWTS